MLPLAKEARGIGREKSHRILGWDSLGIAVRTQGFLVSVGKALSEGVQYIV